jgi:hypothetical protein
MPKYFVELHLVQSADVEIEVEADNEDDASSIAWDRYEQDDIEVDHWWADDCTIESVTLDEED